MNSPEPPITVLGVEDAGELLTLQRAAYVTEAQAHDDPRLPPLLETLAEVRADLRSDATTVLGIRDRGRLIATLRVRHDPADPSTAEIARLAVAPDRQGEGLGTRLLAAAEQHVPAETTVLALFTGEYSHGNLRLYERHGYTETHRSPAGAHQLVHMRKPIGYLPTGRRPFSPTRPPPSPPPAAAS